MPIQKTLKFLQEPHPETAQQPDLWEFQESADFVPSTGGAGWFDLFWADPFVEEVPCGLSPGYPYIYTPSDGFDPNGICYYTNIWIESDTNWIRARAVQEVPLLSSEWSEPLYVPEPSITTLLMVGIIMLAFLKNKGFIRIS